MCDCTKCEKSGNCAKQILKLSGQYKGAACSNTRLDGPDFSHYYLPLFGHVPGTACAEDDASYLASITADSTPDYGSAVSACYWDTKHYIAYYNALVAKYGADQGAQRWGDAWDAGRTLLNAYNHQYTIKTSDQNFIQFVKNNSLQNYADDLRPDIIDKAAATTANVATDAMAVVDNTANSVTSTTKSLGTILKWLPWIGLAVGVILIGIVTYKYFKGQQIIPAI